MTSTSVPQASSDHAAAVVGATEDPPEGLRERKKRERQRALRQAAIDLTLEKGYANVTIEDICGACGVSRRTFFNYFSSKEEALLGRTDTVFDDEDQPAIAEFEEGGPSGRFLADFQDLLVSIARTRLGKRAEMAQYHRMMTRDPSLIQVQLSRMGTNERLFREIIQRRLDGDGPAAADPSPRAGALAALAMVAVKTTFVRLRDVDGDPADIITEIFTELRTIFTEESA